MNSLDDRLKALDNPNLTPDKHALLRCRMAAELIHTGQYEAAREALGNLWQDAGNRPELKDLSILTTGEVLLQCGVLSGWLGSMRHVSNVQEKAKDLLFEALRIFESQNRRSKASEVQYELGMCYWRAGAYDEARVILAEALKGIGQKDIELTAKILIRRSIVEIWSGRYHDAWDILKEAEPFFESCGDALKGRWHGQKGIVLRRLATTEGRTDYFDRAIIEYTAAIYHYEQAKHERYAATNLNNLAFLLYKVGRYKEAHEHLDRSQRMLTSLKDIGNLAQMNETRARVLIAEQRYEEANRLISGAVAALEAGGEFGLLADALSVQGIALARLGMHERSLHTLRRAMNVATDAGASSNAGQAALTLIEEHAPRLSEIELYAAYRRADRMLKDTQDAEDIARLRACARTLVVRLRGPKLSDKDFDLTRVVRAYEARFIEQALEIEEGSVSRAAKRLGFKHHYSLTHILKTRQTHLLKKRVPAMNRRRSIISVPRQAGSNGTKNIANQQVPHVCILLVEDSIMVAETVRESLEFEGWGVTVCADGVKALREIESQTSYDLLLLDNNLPGIHGLELLRRARQMRHRRQTPIIMLSASDVEREARSAGADAFLSKPQGILFLTNTINWLLSAKDQQYQ